MPFGQPRIEQEAEQELEEIVAALRQRIKDSHDNEGSPRQPAGPALQANTCVAVPVPSEQLDAFPPMPSPPPATGAAPIDLSNRHYTLSELTGVDDNIFIEHVYRCLLKREPDSVGLAHHVQMLASGSKSKADIAIGLSVSPEARAAGTSLRLPVRTRLYQIVVGLPLIGGLVRTSGYLARIQATAVNQQQDHYHLLSIGRMVSHLSSTVNMTIDRLAAVSAQADGLRREVQSAKAENDRRLQRVFATLGFLDSQKAGVDETTQLRLDLENLFASQRRQEKQILETRALVDQSLAELTQLESLQTRVHEVFSACEASRAIADQVAEQMHAQGHLITSELASRSARIDDLHQEIEQVRQEVVSKVEIADLESKVTRAELQDVLASHNITGRLSDVERTTFQSKSRVADMDRRLYLVLEELRKRRPAPLSEDQMKQAAAVLEQLSDATYVWFEDIYRGTRDDIKSRQSIYVPRVSDVVGSFECAIPVLDLGCGRGEWLEVLKEHRIQATGVDANSVMVEQCQQFGLMAVEKDAIGYLAGLPPNAAGVITGFHIIEHLPLHLQLRLIDESLRVLVPGGLLILETPNPANLQVGGNSFYLDPTHIKPVPAPQLMFLLEARGFVRAEILPLHPATPPDTLSDSPEGRLIQKLLFGPQDYAVLARKA